jgi:ABC-type branched-subunit amino acid transport system ATPase component
MPAYGPRRLVLINAATFSYAEVDLTQPLHLVGPNNIGKTTLVNVLQLLYIDQKSHMVFPGHRWAETKRHYFPGRRSYVLFECHTPRGRQVVGAYGQGPAERYSPQRFTCTGPFERRDFLDETEEGEVPREADAVTQRLALKDYRTLEASDLRKALTSKGGAGTAGLGLVPVRSSDGYGTFRALFKGLIQMRQLSQSDVKARLCSTYASELEARAVDVREMHADELAQIEAYRQEIATFDRHRQDVEAALDIADEHARLQRRLVSDWVRLRRASMRRRAVLAGTQGAVQRRIRAVDAARSNADRRTADLEDKKDALNQEIGTLREKERRLKRCIEQAPEADPETIEARRDELDTKRAQLLAALEDVEDASPDALRKRRDRAVAQIRRLEHRLERLQGLAGAFLKRHLREEALHRLFRVLNPILLDLTLDASGVLIEDQDALLERLRAEAERLSDGRWAIPGGSVLVEAVPAPSVDDYTDPEKIRAALTHHQEQKSRLDEKLEVAENVRARRREARALKDKLEALRKQRDHQKRAQQAREALPEVQENLAGKMGDREAVATRLEEAHDTQERLREKHRDLKTEQRALRRRAEALGERIEALALPPASGDVLLQPPEASAPDYGPTPVPLLPATARRPWEKSLQPQLDRYTERRTREARLDEDLSQRLAHIHRATYEKYYKDTRAQSLKALADEMEALDERRHTVRQLWENLMTGLRRRLSDLLSSLDTMKSIATRINRRLHKHSVSDLKKLSLVIQPVESLVRLLERIAEYETAPLFGEEGTYQDDRDRLRRLLDDHPKLRLEDLFTVGFKVVTVDGHTRRYDGLKNIQSNGTSITIKVLVYLVLIGDLLGDADVRIPFYLDEASSLDDYNLGGIVRTATDLGFVPVLASPSESAAVPHIYYLQSDGERVYLGPEHRAELRKSDGVALQEP